MIGRLFLVIFAIALVTFVSVVWPVSTAVSRPLQRPFPIPKDEDSSPSDVSSTGAGEYVAEEMFLVPWGTEPGTFSDDFTHPTSWPNSGPDPWLVTSDGELFAADSHYGGKRRIMRFSSDGELVRWIDIGAMGLNEHDCDAFSPMPYTDMAMLGTGEILFGQGCCLVLFSPLLEVLLETELPFEGGRVVSIYPSDSDIFYIVFESKTPPTEEESLRIYYHFVELDTGGLFSCPEIIARDELKDDFYWSNRQTFITPSGDKYNRVVDKYGYRYREGPWVRKTDAGGEEIFRLEMLGPQTTLYEHENYADAYVTWDGDFYTLHGTETGAILTKYNLTKS